VILITNAPRPADSVQRQLRKPWCRGRDYDAIVSSGDLARISSPTTPAGRCSGSARSATIRSTVVSIRCSRRWSRADYIVCTGLFDDETESAEDYAR